MSEVFGATFPKSAVAIIDIVIIVFMEIIPDINIIPTVVVQIGDGKTQAIAQAALVDTCLSGDIGKFPRCAEIVAIESAACVGIEFPTVGGIDDILVGVMR